LLALLPLEEKPILGSSGHQRSTFGTNHPLLGLETFSVSLLGCQHAAAWQSNHGKRACYILSF
jgi:hypothetical protein